MCFQKALEVAGRFISITGDAAKNGCNYITPTPKLVTQAALFKTYGTNLIVNDSASLVLDCLPLCDHNRDGGSVLVQASRTA